MADLGLQALRNWYNQFYTANGQQLITGPIGNTGFNNTLDTLLGIINTTFGQTAPMIADATNVLKGGVPVAGDTLAKLYNLILALETTDFQNTYTAMTAVVYNENKLIVVKNAADGPDVESGAALYFYNDATTTFEFLAGYGAISFEAEPAGSDREIQFNNAGAAGADANLKWDAVLGLLLGANKPISLQGGAVQLVPATVEAVNLLRILINEVEVARLSPAAFEILGGAAVAAPRIQHPATDLEPVYGTNADAGTGLGFVYNVTEAKWIPAFYVGGAKAFEVHPNYLLLQDGTRIATADNVVELYPSDNKVKALSLGKNDKRFNTISVLVGDAEDGEAGIIIDYRGISYSADLSGINLLNANWLTSKKYVDDADTAMLTAIRGGVPVAGDNLNKLYVLIQGINTILQSDDVALDQVQEIVNYIKANKALIDQVTINKVNVVDIINNLTSDDTNKPLSAAQGKALKGLIDNLNIVPDLSAFIRSGSSIEATGNEQFVDFTSTLGTLGYSLKIQSVPDLGIEYINKAQNGFTIKFANPGEFDYQAIKNM